MSWRKKASAPDYANLAEKVEALITGGPDAWVLPWFNLMPGNVNMDVNAFCALGPPEVVEFGPLDFVGFIGGTRLGGALSSVSLGDKIAQWAFGKLFQAYCEQATSVPGAFCDFYTGSQLITGDWSWTPTPSVPIPAGATQVRVTLTGGGPGFANQNYLRADESLVSQGGGFTSGSGPHTEGIPAGAVKTSTQVRWSGSNYTATVVYAWDCGTSTTSYTPPPVVQPPSAIAPAPRVYVTIPDLGKELDALEMKLHWILGYTSDRVVADIAPLVADEILPVADAATDVPLAADVAGFILNVTGIPPFVDETFPAPNRLHRLGRVLLGNGVAWSPPIEVTVVPMLILKESTFHTVVRVQLNTPAVGSVTTLVKAPPLG